MTGLVGELVGAAVLLGVFLALIGAAELWSRFGSPPAETTRKFVHLGSGFVCLLFPFLLDSAWTVLGMAAAMTVFFRVAAVFGLLPSIFGVDRTSKGSEYYPLAIFLVFLLAADEPWIYVASVLILGVADAGAALVGARWGTLEYTVQEDKKSLEGSTVFFAVAALAIFLPGLALGPEPPLELMLSALIGAAILTGFEAIALQGSDNLFVPVAACVVLREQATDSLDMLVDQSMLLAGIFLTLVLLNRLTSYWGAEPQTAVNTGGTIALAMFSYAVWTLGGRDWAIPVFVLFGLFILAWLAVALVREARHRIAVRTTYRALLAPFTVLVFAYVFKWYDALYGPFLACLASILAYGAWNRIRGNRVPVAESYPQATAAIVGLVGGAAIVAIPTATQSLPPWGSALAIVLLTGLLAPLNARLVEFTEFDPSESMWPGPSFHLTAVHAGLVLLGQYLGWLGTWNPSLWNV